MPIVIAHGQPKSGSTFLYMCALEASNYINQKDFHSFRKERLGAEFPAFVDDINSELISKIDRAISPNEVFVIKTHCKLTSEIASKIEKHEIIAFTSFRDPRDSALSILDKGEEERKNGIDRWFSKITSVQHVTNPIAYQFDNVSCWVKCQNVLAIPYYLICMAEEYAIRLVCNHMGAGAYYHRVASNIIQKRSQLPEFNKAIMDRFVDELPTDSLRFIDQNWRQTIDAYDRLLGEKMREFGFTMACQQQVSKRNERIRLRTEAV